MFTGLVAACITPRNASGEIDFGAMFELIDFLCAARIGGIALFTAAGEYPSLTLEERARVAYLAVKRSRAPVLVAIGSAGLDSSAELAREARRAGAAALLAPPPYFYQYGQDDLREFYIQLASQIDCRAAVYLHNTPAVTSGIATETAAELMSTERFAGVVDSSGNLDMARAMPHVLTGDDAIYAEARRSGLCGGVSELACAAPELMMALERAIIRTGAEVDALADKIREFVAWARQFPAPVALKTATALRGLKTGSFPVPLTPAKRRKLEEFREWFRDWLGAVKILSAHA
jgi:4-hydroxy-tetrahydrodipicolinate synthase